MASSVAPQQPPADWDEAQCKSALAELERLQAQLDDLRLTIPRVVAPLTPQTTRRPELFAAFRKATVDSQSNIKTFRARWQGQEIKSILEHTTASLEANPDLSASAQVPKYGWIQSEEKEKAAKSRNSAGAQSPLETQVGLSKEERAQILVEWRKANPAMKVWTKDDDSDLMIHFVAQSLKLRFHVVIAREANGGDKLNVECLGTVEPFTSIARCVASRPQANELKYLLDMIAAYKTVNGSPCAKCERLLDNSALVPTARRSKQVTGATENSETVWEAFHESCLD